MKRMTLNSAGFELDTLSMGMTNDLEAVLEGATIVRIGTAVFGPRAPRWWRPSRSAALLRAQLASNCRDLTHDRSGAPSFSGSRARRW